MTKLKKIIERGNTEKRTVDFVDKHDFYQDSNNNQTPSVQNHADPIFKKSMSYHVKLTDFNNQDLSQIPNDILNPDTKSDADLSDNRSQNTATRIRKNASVKVPEINKLKVPG